MSCLKLQIVTFYPFIKPLVCVRVQVRAQVQVRHFLCKYVLTAIPYREITGFLQGFPCVVILHLHALAVYTVQGLKGQI